MNEATVALINNADKGERMKGIALAVQEQDYELLPFIIKLIAQPDRDLVRAALSASLSLAKKCVTERSGAVPEALSGAAVAVIKSQLPEFVEGTAALLDDPSPDQVVEAMIILRHFLNEKKAVETMRRFMKHGDPRIRATLIRHLGPLACRTNAEVLNKFLEDQDPRVRANAVEALEKLGNRYFIRVLQRYLTDRHHRIRANAIKALFHFGESGYFDQLKEMISHFENPEMRAAAVWAVGEVGQKDRAVLALLKTAEGDNNDKVRAAIKGVLRKVGHVPELEFLKARMREELRREIKSKIMGTTELKLVQERKDRYYLFKLSGNLTVDTFLSLRFHLEEAESWGRIGLVMDFTEVDYVDSSGAGLLANYTRRMAEKGGFLYLYGCNAKINDLFQVTGMDFILKIYPTEKEIREILG